MNLSVRDVKGEVLLVSQFTLYGDARKGNRPSFSEAERPERADALYEHAVSYLRSLGVPVQTGVFGADMQISQHNDGKQAQGKLRKIFVGALQTPSVCFADSSLMEGAEGVTVFPCLPRRSKANFAGVRLTANAALSTPAPPLPTNLFASQKSLREP